MTTQTWILTNKNDVVIHVIEADEMFIETLRSSISDSEIETPSDIPVDFKAYPLTDSDRDSNGFAPNVGHYRTTNGSWALLPEVKKAQEEASLISEKLEAEKTLIEADDARLKVLRTKVGPGKPGLTQAERDELMLIQLSRS